MSIVETVIAGGTHVDQALLGCYPPLPIDDGAVHSMLGHASTPRSLHVELLESRLSRAERLLMPVAVH